MTRTLLGMPDGELHFQPPSGISQLLEFGDLTMKLLSKIFDSILKGTVIFGCLLVVLMGASICYQVILRYLFNIAPLWVNDFVEYSLLALTFLGSAYVLKEERHIEVDLVTNHLHQKNQMLLKIITSFAGAVSCSILAFYAFHTVWDNYVRNVIVVKTLDTPKYIVLLPIAVGSTLLGIQFFRRTAYYIKESKDKVTRIIERVREGV
jgi:TRAP-type C4-dicarboxylate transport system permease small subunit